MFVAPHGATLINALLLPPGAVAIEVYPLPERYGAGEWTRYLQMSGVRCLEYCYNGARPCPLCAGSKPYPYNNSVVDVEQFRPVVGAALDMIRSSRAPQEVTDAAEIPARVWNNRRPFKVIQATETVGSI